MITAVFVGLFLLVSLTFNCLGVISMYRFPDVYTRLHGATKCTTFGTLFSVFAMLAYSFSRFLGSASGGRFMVLFIHTIIAAIVLLISNPTGSHALARAAHRRMILPYPAVIDELEQDQNAKQKGGAAE